MASGTVAPELAFEEDFALEFNFDEDLADDTSDGIPEAAEDEYCDDGLDDEENGAREDAIPAAEAGPDDDVGLDDDGF